MASRRGPLLSRSPLDEATAVDGIVVPARPGLPTLNGARRPAEDVLAVGKPDGLAILGRDSAGVCEQVVGVDDDRSLAELLRDDIKDLREFLVSTLLRVEVVPSGQLGVQATSVQRWDGLARMANEKSVLDALEHLFVDATAHIVSHVLGEDVVRLLLRISPVEQSISDPIISGEAIRERSILGKTSRTTLLCWSKVEGLSVGFMQDVQCLAPLGEDLVAQFHNHTFERSGDGPRNCPQHRAGPPLRSRGHGRRRSRGGIGRGRGRGQGRGRRNLERLTIFRCGGRGDDILR
mmetsp:Transcript_357/g.791  ORF Transcript_357/g.791 Transcript_357/m.791 type:complete len:292 (-) Transcript_357:121-996(-)